MLTFNHTALWLFLNVSNQLLRLHFMFSKIKPVLRDYEHTSPLLERVKMIQRGTRLSRKICYFCENQMLFQHLHVTSAAFNDTLMLTFNHAAPWLFLSKSVCLTDPISCFVTTRYCGTITTAVGFVLRSVLLTCDALIPCLTSALCACFSL